MAPSMAWIRYSTSNDRPPRIAAVISSVTGDRSSGIGNRPPTMAPGVIRSFARYPAIDSMASLMYWNGQGGAVPRR